MNLIKKEIIVIIALVAAGFIFVTGDRNFQIDRSAKTNDVTISLPSFEFPSLDIQGPDDTQIANEAWNTLQKYLGFAVNHDLAGIRSLSHQISPTCEDLTKQQECFALMDNVYAIANDLEQESFKYIQRDARQVVMYTDGPVVLILYFTQADDKVLKILGLRACIESETSEDKCVKPETLKSDTNSNGWWDSVESLFYQ